MAPTAHCSRAMRCGPRSLPYARAVSKRCLGSRAGPFSLADCWGPGVIHRIGSKHPGALCPPKPASKTRSVVQMRASSVHSRRISNQTLCLAGVHHGKQQTQTTDRRLLASLGLLRQLFMALRAAPRNNNAQEAALRLRPSCVPGRASGLGAAGLRTSGSYLRHALRKGAHSRHDRLCARPKLADVGQGWSTSCQICPNRRNEGRISAPIAFFRQRLNNCSTTVGQLLSSPGS